MKINISDTSYIETDEMTYGDLTRAICEFQTLAATRIWSALMDEQRRRRECKINYN